MSLFSLENSHGIISSKLQICCQKCIFQNYIHNKMIIFKKACIQVPLGSIKINFKEKNF